MSERDEARHVLEYSNQAVNWWLELDAHKASNDWTDERQRALQHVVEQCMWRLAAAIRLLRAPAEGWQDIESAPKDRRIDIAAKVWLPAFDRFEWHRFTNCSWYAGDSMTNSKPCWLNVDKGWCPTHWREIPAVPAPPATEGDSK